MRIVWPPWILVQKDTVLVMCHRKLKQFVTYRICRNFTLHINILINERHDRQTFILVISNNRMYKTTEERFE